MLRHADVSQEALARIGYQPVAPIGKRKVFGHQNMGDKPHVWGEFEIDDFPSSPEGRALRDFCIARDIGLRKASALLGISAVHLSNLHRGAATCNWEFVRKLLEGETP
jgi:hypothetical protein